MAPSSKANYKTYEAQARLLRAIVAAHSDVKWNYKDIAACFGSDMTEDALNHRFRRLRAESTIVREGRAAGLDMRDLPVVDSLPKAQREVDTKNISKYFGQSTPDGIQFQFRTIKKDADLLREVAQAGGNVVNCLPAIGNGGGTSTVSTPRKTPSKVPEKAVAARSGGTAKRSHKASFTKRSDSDVEDDDNDELSQDWSERDMETPSKRAKTGGHKKGTPSRRAATKAADTIATAVKQLDSSSEAEMTAPISIFGLVDTDRKPDRKALDSAFADNAFASTGMDAYVGGMYDDDDYGMNLGGDGEI